MNRFIKWLADNAVAILAFLVAALALYEQYSTPNPNELALSSADLSATIVGKSLRITAGKDDRVTPDKTLLKVLFTYKNSTGKVFKGVAEYFVAVGSSSEIDGGRPSFELPDARKSICDNLPMTNIPCDQIIVDSIFVTMFVGSVPNSFSTTNVKRINSLPSS